MNIIRQSMHFDASPDSLFDAYLSSRKHAAIVGSKVSISKAVGRRFAAFNGMLSGKNLLIIPKTFVVQSWRSRRWKKTDADSVLILMFSKTRRGAQIELVHVNVPEHDFLGVARGWHRYYWKPWLKYLKRSSN
ncbi:MAG TPA: SRPBCC domain-containing protein [Burkholderiales bacterium]|nr:SRPBCC domain-containing protein [Burkholderiales bacterium]